MKLTPEKAILIAHKRWLSRNELALYLDMSPDTVDCIVRPKLHETRATDKRPLFDRHEVDAWLESRKVLA